HANLVVEADGQATIEDLDSANGTFVEGIKVADGGVPVKIGDAIALGETVVEMRQIVTDAAVIEPGDPGWINFVRPPRIVSDFEAATVEFPKEPPKPPRRPFPVISLAIPLLFGVVMAFVMHSPRYLLFMLMSPLMMLGNMITDRRSGGKQAREDTATFADRMGAAEQEFADAITEEKHRRRADAPDASTAYLAAVTPSLRLWERRPTDSDFLTLRVGTGRLESTTRVINRDETPMVCDVPITVNLGNHRVLGIAGQSESVDKLLAWLVVQMATWHAPRDISMSYLASKCDAEWAWLAWLPQMRDDESPDAPLARLACEEKTAAEHVAWLQEVVMARKSAPPGTAFTPHVLVIRGYRSLRLIPGLSQVLQDGPKVGVLVICSDEQERALPEECQAVFTFNDAGSAVGALACQGEPVERNVLSEQVSPEWCDLLAREMAPLHDIGTEEHGSALPNASRLLDVLDLDDINGQIVANGWHQSYRSTAAVIGELADDAFSLDVRTDGPHGLIAGTTGSGKSELLQTLIASLALKNRPDEFNFVLIDYKGGAAFKDCARLPHTVGTVTDLDGHLTTRALASLAAELRRREHQLASLGAKDIEDYQAAMTPTDPHMPRLLIVIDEFAALVQELPDFVAGLVDIARRGRSLGVHLLLATQRPAGVVSNEIKSNTNLRIALRVTDASDSVDVIESPNAAHISKSTPGRAFARLGHSSLIEFQSSRVGGRAAEAEKANVSTRRVAMNALYAVLPPASVEEDTSSPTDLARLVDACRGAAALEGIETPPSPWLDALPSQIGVADIFEQFPEADNYIAKMAVPFGVTDLPAKQSRGLAAFDVTDGVNLAVIGTGRSGKSGMLRTVAGLVGQHFSPVDIQMYAMDCGGGSLLPLEKLPHVGAVVLRDQGERASRMASMLRGAIAQRQQQLSMDGFANLREQRVSSANPLPFVLVLLDSWEGLFQTYDNVDNGALVTSFLQIAQEGPSVGVATIVTGDRTLLSGRVSNLFPNKLMLHMTDPGDFAYVGIPAKSVPKSMPPGRGFFARDLVETQIALLDPDPAGAAQVQAIQAISQSATRDWAELSFSDRPRRVDLLPSSYKMSAVEALPRAFSEEAVLPVAVGGDTLSLMGLDVMSFGPLFLVAGPRHSGRSTTLKTMALFAMMQGWSVVVVTTRQSPLQRLAPHPRLLGSFADDLTHKDDLTAMLERLQSEDNPSLVVVDDVDRLDQEGWLVEALVDHISAVRDTASAVVASSVPSEVAGYRGLMPILKKAGAGVMLWPQGPNDSELFSTALPRSAWGESMPPGGGFLVQSGRAVRAQVVFPDVDVLG
ncbi:MAG: FtsK/SpoIIIE domain-containing protein, partial [Propionibacteriaceae bacterium]|nr:FtsK/SpoIIIE domain-containing protein [Propionibacteriaceae bacterium]